jgi:hypothetical protein
LNANSPDSAIEARGERSHYASMPAHFRRYQLHRPTARPRFTLDPSIDSALTDLRAYALALDAECRRVRDCEVPPTDSSRSSAPISSGRPHGELEEELAALRTFIAGFGAQAGSAQA